MGAVDYHLNVLNFFSFRNKTNLDSDTFRHTNSDILLYSHTHISLKVNLDSVSYKRAKELAELASSFQP